LDDRMTIHLLFRRHSCANVMTRSPSNESCSSLFPWTSRQVEEVASIFRRHYLINQPMQENVKVNIKISLSRYALPWLCLQIRKVRRWSIYKTLYINSKFFE
jgi:hypothetical protein